MISTKILAVILLGITSLCSAQTPLGTEFTYQGELQLDNQLANG